MTSTGCKQTIFVGDRFLTTNGWAEVISYESKEKVTIQFDTTKNIVVCPTSVIRSGAVKDKMLPAILGVGYLGNGEKDSRNSAKAHALWSGVLERCYNLEFQEKHPTYKSCSVREDWLNFQNFVLDYEPMIKEDGWELDKDLLVKGNRIYSKDTCIFLPKEVNLVFCGRRPSGNFNLPLGVFPKNSKFQAPCSIHKKSTYLGVFDTTEEAFAVYKFHKEKEIKRVADIWKNRLDKKAYDALINYRVEITD